MATRVLIGTDGSEDALAAARRGVDLLAADATVYLICVAEPPPFVHAGTESGFAGGIPSQAQVDDAWAGVIDEANAALERTASALGAAIAIEDGGPPVPEEGRSRGFGTDLIEKIVAHELGNPVDLRFERHGVECSLNVPVREASEFALRARRSLEQ